MGNYEGLTPHMGVTKKICMLKSILECFGFVQLISKFQMVENSLEC
jgi:hypothetical protein